MKLKKLLLGLVVTFSGLALAQDPFMGTWTFSEAKSPKPTITYGVRDLGGDRYALTGSTGETTEIKADGISIKSPSGNMVSFKKIDAHSWQMDRVETATMVRTYTVSPDDTRLTLVDVFTLPKGGHRKTTTTYARTAPGKSIFGQWRSIAMEDETSEEDSFTLTPFGQAGFSITSAGSDKRKDYEMDGEQHPDKDPGSSQNKTTSGTRVDAHHIQVEDQVDGKPDETESYEVSEDGKTLTIVNIVLKTSARFTSVWDKK